MIINKTFNLLAFSFCLFVNIAHSQTENKDIKLNVLRYKTNLEPDVEEKYIQGEVTINFILNADINEVVFNSGNLEITRIIGESVVDYVQEDKKVIISLAFRATNENQVQIFYDGIQLQGGTFSIMYVVELETWKRNMACNKSMNMTKFLS